MNWRDFQISTPVDKIDNIDKTPEEVTFCRQSRYCRQETESEKEVKEKAPSLPVDVMPPTDFDQGNQIITWRTGSGRTIFIAPSWAVEKYRQPGQAWFTPWEIVELRAMQLDADTIERIIDMKELMGTQIIGTC